MYIKPIKLKKIKQSLKIISIATIFSLCCAILPNSTLSTPIYADTTEDLEAKISDIQAENQRIESEIAAYNSSISESEALQSLVFQKLANQKEEVDTLNNQIYYKELEIDEKEAEINAKTLEIENKQTDIDTLTNAIAQTEADIEDKKTKIADLEAENQANIDKFGELIAAMSISENTDIISVLAGSSDLTDFLVKNDMMNSIAEQNVQFMNGLLDDIDELNQMAIDLQGQVVKLDNDRKKLEDDKIALETEKMSLENDKQLLVGEKEELDAAYYESAALSQQYNEDYNNYSTQISNFEYMQEQLAAKKEVNQAEIAAYTAQIQEIIRLAQEGSTQEYEQGEWLWPLDYKYSLITTYFGYDSWRGGNHSGIDVGNSGINGANIYAAKGGKVIKAVTSYIQGYSYGMYVVIDHGNGLSTLYGHCSAVYVYEGQTVSQGDVIAAVGSTGWSTGPHLHFEVRQDSIAQNPFNYVNLP